MQIDIFERRESQVCRKGAHLHDRLSRIVELVPGAELRGRGMPGAELRGRGMMQGINVGAGEVAGRICATAFQRGLIIETSGADDEVVKFLGPLTTQDEVLDAGLDILEAAVRDVASETHQTAE